MFMREKQALLFVCMVLSALLLSGVAAAADIIDRTVANVNGEIILYSDVQAQLKVLENISPEAKTDDPAKKSEIEKEILNQLVRQRLAEQEVKRLKISVSDIEVDDTVANIMRENRMTPSQFEIQLKKTGQTMDKFREGVKKELERSRLIERTLKSKVVITDQQVEAYLKNDSGESLPGSQRIRLGIIFLPADEKNKADVEKTGREVLEKLKSGSDFRSLAKQYSKGPAVEDGGDIGFMSPDELAPYIAEGIKGLKREEISGLVRGPNGYYLLKVFDVEVLKQNKSDPSLREKVRRELYQKEVNRKFEEWVRNLEAKAFIQTSL